MERFTFFLLLALLNHYVRPQELTMVSTEEYTTENVEVNTESPMTTDQLTNKTLSELVQEQTDVIKQIISEQKLQSSSYQTMKKEPQKDTSALKLEKEKQFIEELKLKCKFFGLAVNPEIKSTTTTEKPIQTIQPFGPPLRPQFWNYRPKLPVMKPRPQNGYYYIFSQNPYRTNKLADTLESAGTTISEDKIQMHTTENLMNVDMDGISDEIMHFEHEKMKNVTHQKLKYVRLEPLILQKTFLTNGNTLLHWFRMVPGTQSFIQIPDIPETENINTIAQPQTNPYQSVPLPEQYLYYVDPHTGAIIRNLYPKPTKTTTPLPVTTTPLPLSLPLTTNQGPPQYYINPQNGLIYQPYVYQRYVHETTSTTTTTEIPTTTQKIETTTSELPKQSIHYTIDYSQYDKFQDKFKNEYRFVIPMMVTGNEEISKYSYPLDPYAYLPKDQRPEYMNVALPYVPNYHMIKAIAVPKKYSQTEVDPVRN